MMCFTFVWLLYMILFDYLVPNVLAQSFVNCDFYKDMRPGVIYSIASPNYSKKYPAGTWCRYIGQAPTGYQIILTCNEVNIPYSDRCSGDRLQVSRAGNSNLADSERYCTGTFSTRSFSTRIVMALLSPPESYGGKYRCEMYAVAGCDCGRRKQTRIVGGVETGINEFPSMAAIVAKSTGQLLCGATIIDARYALTAAHCVNSPGRFSNQIDLLVGDHDYKNPSETPYTLKYEVASAIRHPKYSTEKDTNDIAILVMRSSIVFNPGVGPVCMPFKYRTASFVGRQIEALGWGTIDFGGPVSNRLLKVYLDVVEQSRCEKTYPNSVTSAQICTFTRGKDTCSYDSGGPLMYSDVAGNNLLYQIGITSYGLNCASSTPSVSTKVSSYLDWIRSNTPYANYCEQ